MVHPYKRMGEKAIKDMEKISVTLEICTLYKGLPHGIAIISYSDPTSNWYSFRGVGVFNQGELHNAPFTYVTGDSVGYTYTKMENGRPAVGSYHT